MKVLIFDTSTDYLYVRFYDDEKKITFYEKEMISHNNHSENLLSTIEEGLNETGLELASFNKIIIGMGPGSYTGLRISMVVGKMASYTLNIPLYTISSLSLCGSGYFGKNGVYAIRIKAKKDYSYLKIVSVKDNQVETLVDDSYMTDEDAKELVQKYSGMFISEGMYKLDVEEIIKEAVLVGNVHELVPNYLRKANS